MEWESLPPVALHCVSSYLKHAEAVQLRQVCKDWSRKVDPLIEINTVSLRDLLNWPQAPSSPIRFLKHVILLLDHEELESVKKGTLDIARPRFMPAFKAMPMLQKLTLRSRSRCKIKRGRPMSYPPAHVKRGVLPAIATVAQHCASLMPQPAVYVEVDFYPKDKGEWMAITSCPAIRGLQVSTGRPYIPAIHLQLLLEMTQLLELSVHFDLDSQGHLPQAGWTQLTRMTNLQDLSMHCYGPPSVLPVHCIPSSLCKLSLSGSINLGLPNQLSDPLTNLVNLQSLHLIQPLTDSMFHLLVRSAPALVNLKLSAICTEGDSDLQDLQIQQHAFLQQTTDELYLQALRWCHQPYTPKVEALLRSGYEALFQEEAVDSFLDSKEALAEAFKDLRFSNNYQHHVWWDFQPDNSCGTLNDVGAETRGTQLLDVSFPVSTSPPMHWEVRRMAVPSVTLSLAKRFPGLHSTSMSRNLALVLAASHHLHVDNLQRLSFACVSLLPHWTGLRSLHLSNAGPIMYPTHINIFPQHLVNLQVLIIQGDFVRHSDDKWQTPILKQWKSLKYLQFHNTSPLSSVHTLSVGIAHLPVNLETLALSRFRVVRDLQAGRHGRAQERLRGASPDADQEPRSGSMGRFMEEPTSAVEDASVLVLPRLTQLALDCCSTADEDSWNDLFCHRSGLTEVTLSGWGYTGKGSALSFGYYQHSRYPCMMRSWRCVEKISLEGVNICELVTLAEVWKELPLLHHLRLKLIASTASEPTIFRVASYGPFLGQRRGTTTRSEVQRQLASLGQLHQLRSLDVQYGLGPQWDRTVSKAYWHVVRCLPSCAITFSRALSLEVLHCERTKRKLQVEEEDERSHRNYQGMYWRFPITVLCACHQQWVITAEAERNRAIRQGDGQPMGETSIGAAGGRGAAGNLSSRASPLRQVHINSKAQVRDILLLGGQIGLAYLVIQYITIRMPRRWVLRAYRFIMNRWAFRAIMSFVDAFHVCYFLEAVRHSWKPGRACRGGSHMSVEGGLSAC